MFALQMYKEIARPPEKLNKTRGIGIIDAPPDLVAAVVADEYEAWDDSMKDLKTLTSERDPQTGALVEICWSRYCLRESFPLLPAGVLSILSIGESTLRWAYRLGGSVSSLGRCASSFTCRCTELSTSKFNCICTSP